MRELTTAGVDEVGRGCLAGPVVSAAVILKKGINLSLLKDSKKITFKKREEISKHIKSNSYFAIGIASVEEILNLNILQASLLSMKRAINNLKHKVNLKIYLIIFVLINLTLLNYGNYRKLESHFFRENLVDQLKEIGSIPRGNVELFGKNIPADLRPYEISYIFYKAYNLAGWWGKTSNSLTSSEPPQVILKKEGYSTHSILNDYKNECSIYVYLKNDLKKIDRIKKFYILNYKKHYNIDKILKKC